MKSKKTVIKCTALILGVLVIPILYSYLYLGAFWDPYNSLDKLPVAVVNSDKGAEIDGTQRNLGNELVDKLKSNDELKWVFVDKEEAQAGVNGKKYYASIVIPSDFSSDIASASSTNKKTATLVYSANEKRNYLASQILNRAIVSLEEETRSTVDKELTSQLTKKLAKVPSDLGTLKDGLTTLSGGAATLQDGIGQAADGNGTLSGGISTLSSGISTLSDGAGTLSTNLETLDSGLGEALSGAQQLNAGVGNLPTLSGGITTLNNAASQLSGGLSALLAQFGAGTASAPTLHDSVKSLNSGAGQIAAGTSKLLAAFGDGSAQNQTLKYQVNQLNGGAQGAAAQFASGSSSNLKALVDGIANTSTGAPAYVNTMSSLVTGLRSNTLVYDSIKASLIAATDASAKQSLASTLVLLTDTGNSVEVATTIGLLAAGGTTITAEQIQTQQTTLANGGSSLTSAVALLSQQFSPTTTSTPTLYDAVTGVASGTSTLAAQMATSGDAANPTLYDSVNALNTGAQQVATGTSKLEAQMNTAASGQTPTLYDSVNALSSGASQIAGGTSQLNASLPQLTQLEDGMSRLTSALQQLKSGSAQLFSGSKQLAAGASSAKSGALKLSTGSAALSNGLSQLKNGSVALAAGLNTATTGVSDSITTANTELATTDGLDTFASAPVTIKNSPVYSIPNYGGAFAPYFLSLSLWVGALITFVGIYLDPFEKIKVLTKDSDKRIFRSITFFVIGIGQALLLAVALQYGLHLSLSNPTVFYLSCILVSFTFMAIVQFLIVFLQDVGKFLAIFFLILQLTSCGGTFPMETVPKFFNVLYRFMPMTYSVGLFKEAISGLEKANAWYNAYILMCIFAVFFSITILFSLTRKVKTKVKERLEAQAQAD